MMKLTTLLKVSITCLAIVASTKALAWGVSQAPSGNRKPATASPSRAQTTKPEALARLRIFRDRSAKDLAVVRANLRKRLEESRTFKVEMKATALARRRMTVTMNDIEALKSQNDDLLARSELIDRILFTIETKWTTEPLQAFLERQFIEMANAELVDGGGGRLWKAFFALSIAVRELSESREDLLGVLENYILYAGTLNPKSPIDYLSTRDYSNSSESVAAKTPPSEAPGDEVEKKIASGLLATPVPNPAQTRPKGFEEGTDIPLELRLKIGTIPSKIPIDETNASRLRQLADKLQSETTANIANGAEANAEESLSDDDPVESKIIDPDSDVVTEYEI